MGELVSWWLHATHPWQAPLELAARYADEPMSLLHSGMLESGARYSFLLLHPLEAIVTARWDNFPRIPADARADLPYFVAMLGYGLRCNDEKTPRASDSFIHFADATFIRYTQLFRFDHQQYIIEEFYAKNSAISVNSKTTEATQKDSLKVTSLHSNFDRETYLHAVAQTIQHIEAGDFYQANITRKFFGEFQQTPHYFSLYRTLCELSPAPYSAYIRHGDRAILSSSPECFLTIHHGTITSRPIKGSVARSDDPAQDMLVQTALTQSEKNLAENLMITDLIRHDVSRVAVAGSVKVTEQSALHSYRTIHHLISTITAQKSADCKAYDVVRACFPPGSMTGAPKIAAMQWCTEMERMERGIYSGAIGWFGGEEACDLSVVIRTLVCEGNRFEFQVGGGIVADSTTENEWLECVSKAKAIMHLLGLTAEDLARAAP